MTSEPQQKFSSTPAGSVLWMTAQKWFSRLSGLLTVVILARLLAPADFGLVAIALSIIPFLTLLSDLGFSTYLVQAQNPTPEHFSTAFWYSCIAGTILSFGLGLLGYPLQMFLEVKDVVPILWGLAPVVLFAALGSVPNAMLRRRMRFDLIARQAMLSGVIGQIVAITLALSGFGVWALVAQTLIAQLTGTVMIWIAARWVPSSAFHFGEFRRMAVFGFNVVAVEFTAMARASAENTIVAATLGLNGLGYLNVAQRLIQVAQDLTVTAITPVSTVVFSQLRVDRKRIASAYDMAQAVAYALVTPIMVFIAVCAPLLVPVIFGPQWQPSIGAAQGFAIAGIMTIGAALDHGLLYGLGKPGTWFIYAVIIDGLTVAVTFVTVAHGLEAVAIGFIFVALVATMMRWPLVTSQIDVTRGQLAGQFSRVILLAGATGVAGYIAFDAAADHAPLVRLVIAGCAISLCWLASVYFLFPAALTEGKRLLQKVLDRIRPAAVVADR